MVNIVAACSKVEIYHGGLFMYFVLGSANNSLPVKFVQQSHLSNG